MKLNRSKKAFTITEILVVIAILGILALMAGPKLLGYVQKAELVRIQHDVKIMEQEMKNTLETTSEYKEFSDNAKDLGLLIEANRLLGKEGHAANLEYVPAPGEINGLSKYSAKKETKLIGSELDKLNNGLGVGGLVFLENAEDEEFKELYERYKIIPEEYKEKIGTRLKGNFYSNPEGKVYYEPDKPVPLQKDSEPLICSAIPEPDYTFEHEIGKIVKYHRNAEHLIIPDYFLVQDKCWPVRIIGKGAFMRGNYKSIIIPDTVVTIEMDAFKDNKLTSIYIPGSVSTIQLGAFDGNYEVIYGGSSLQVNGGGGGGSYVHVNGGNSSIIHRTPGAEQAGVVFNPGTGTIVKGNGNGYIPPYINVNGEDIPVKKVAKGAYQGLGLITVILPETLEVIENYAFSGNQLIGITIPSSVKHIGHYAFSFNERWKMGDIPGPDRIATIKTIIIKGKEQFDKVSKIGDILDENKLKINIYKSPIIDGEQIEPDINLLNHIFVTSAGNVVIEEEYIGENDGELVDNWITIQKWTQLIDAGGQGAIWLNSNIQDNMPDGTRIIYGYTTSDDQLTWSSESENIEDTPSGRYLKINIETQRLSSVSGIPRIINISPIYQIQNKVVQTESITKYNEKIDFTQYNNIIYVDFLNGNDSNPGTLGQPLRNIDVAYNKAGNGDLLYLNEGIHTLKVATLTKKVDFYGLSKNTTLVFNGPYQRPFNAGNGYLGINPSADSGFYNMIIETRGSSTYANFFYNKGALAFYNVVFNNFFNLDYTDFVIMEKGSLYLYNVVVTDSAARNLFVRLSTGYEGTLLLQNLYGKLTLDNIHSPRKIDLSVLKDSRIVSRAQLDVNFNILEQNWKNVGLGVNPDGSQANIGVYGGPNSWGSQ